MAPENKPGLTSSAELAREEERISKKKALKLFESRALDRPPSLPCRPSIGTSLARFTTSPVSSAPSTSPRSASASPRWST